MIAAVAASASHVDVTWAGGATTRFQSFWLKLYSVKSESYEGVARRWTDGANFHPPDLDDYERDQIARASVVDDGDAVEVVWRGDDRRLFRAEWLWENAVLVDPVETIEPVVWDARATFPEFDYERVMDVTDDDGLFRLMHTFFAWGIVFVRNVPRRSRQILAVADRLSTLHKSHLGEVFTVRPTDPAAGSIHIGETPDEIPLHIDLVYKQRPPDIQMLHVLKQIERGGENVFVDARRIIEQIDPAELALLRDVPVYFVAHSETVHFRGLHPILAFDTRNRFIGVHYNEYKIVFPVDAPAEYYRAFLHFQEIIKRAENTRALILPRDSIAIFHNRRTLHGRRAFQSQDRHYEGCFISEDDMKCQYRVLWESVERRASSRRAFESPAG